MTSVMKAIKHFKKLKLIFLKYMEKNRREWNTSNSFYEFSIILTPKTDKESKVKKYWIKNL